MRGKNGHVLHMKTGNEGLLQEITERKTLDMLRESEEKYRFLFDATPVGIGIADLEGRVLDANQCMQKMTGFTLEELRQVGIWAVYADPNERRFLLKKLQETGSVRDWEVRMKRKDGTHYYALLNVNLLELEGHKILLTTARDITEQKLADEKLRLFLKAAVDAPGGRHIADLDGSIIYTNRAEEEMYGLSREDEKSKTDTIIAAIGDGIIIQDTDFKILYQNQIQNDMYGDRVGEYCYKTYGNRDTVCKDCPVELSLKDGKIHRAEKCVPTAKGIFYYEFTASPLRDSSGRIIAGIKVVRDITKSRQVEDKLREGERFLESIFTSIQDGIGIVDKDLNILSVNPTAEKWYSHNTPLVGKKCYEAYHRRSERCEPCPTWRTLETGKSAYEVIRKSGPRGEDIGWLEIYSFPMIDTITGKMTGAIEYVRDITERKRAEEAIKKYARELEESNCMKELFADIMHHDLLNPLNIASGYTELFWEDETDPQKRAYLEIIKRNLAKAMELIDCATKFSKIESLETVECEELDLKDIIEESIRNLRPIASTVGMEIQNNITADMPVRANRIIEEVFTNIISNALKYATDGKRVLVEGNDGGDFWRIGVADFGKGIKDADKAVIFERFFRKEKKGVKGSGLGLAIARKIMELHKGRIRVEDNPQGGAIFVVEVPKRLN